MQLGEDKIKVLQDSGYNIIGELGEGGNGLVLKVEKNREELALKILFDKKGEKFERFKREIQFLSDHSDMDGIVPLVNYSIEKNFSYYTMPIAEPLNFSSITDFCKSEIDEIVNAIKQLAEILAKLHKKGYSHRDIKPSNLFMYQGHPAFGDFGLVNLNNANEPLTRDDRALGAYNTMAPEMRRDPANADGKKSDIYSLAKTLWILLTGEEKGFDGQYQTGGAISLRNYISNDSCPLGIIEKLLKDATENDPEYRITIDTFISRCDLYLKSDFIKSIEYEWKFLLEKLFPYGPQTRAEWEPHKTIVKVLNQIICSPMNHMFISTGGGQDFKKAFLSNEEGYIELQMGGLLYKTKPKKLYFESFKDKDWNYFYLETEKIEEIKLNNEIINVEEQIKIIDVLEIEKGEYIDSWHKNYNRNMNSPTHILLPQGIKSKFLVLNGNFVIFNKFSKYNQKSFSFENSNDSLTINAYTAYQSIFSPSKYKNFIEELSKNRISVENFIFLKEVEKKEYSKIPNDSKKIKFSSKQMEDILEKIKLLPNQKKIGILYNFEIIFNNQYTISLSRKSPYFNISNLNFYSSNMNDWLKKFLIDEDNNIKETFNFCEIRCIKDQLLTILKNTTFKDVQFNFDLKLNGKIPMPTIEITKQKLKEALLLGVDWKKNYHLVITFDGEIKIIIEDTCDYFELEQYPVFLKKKCMAYDNYSGPYITEHILTYLYGEILACWEYYLLKKTLVRSVPDQYEEIESMEKNIKKIILDSSQTFL